MTSHDMPLRSDVAVFFDGDELFADALLRLSAAESLTDDLAIALLSGEYDDARRIVAAIHFTDFIVERNSEWNFRPDVREALQAMALTEEGVFVESHRLLLDIAISGGVGLSETPMYLLGPVGRTYHAAFLGVPGALTGYTELAMAARSGEQWLGSQLAVQQVRLGVIETGAIEVTFLSGMVAYREGRSAAAEKAFRSVYASNGIRREVGVAAHLLGRIDMQRLQLAPARLELDRGLTVLEAVSDRFGLALTLHSSAQLAILEGQQEQAEQLFLRSLAIGEELQNEYHMALVLNSLGTLLGQSRPRRRKAESYLRRSVALHEELGETDGASLHSLGQLVGRDPGRRPEAEELLRGGLAIDFNRGDIFGAAKVLHTLGQLIGLDEGRTSEAEGLLRESLAANAASRRDSMHEAQVKYTLGRLLATTKPAEAKRFLEESLALNVEKNSRYIEQVRRELQRHGWIT